MLDSRTSNGVVDPGETWVDFNENGVVDRGEDVGGFGSFNGDSRVAVAQTSTGTSASKFSIAYLATDVTGTLGLYVSRVEITSLKVADPTLVVQVGETIDVMADTVQNLSIHDPVNNKGQIAFWASFASGSTAVVRATIPPLVLNVVTHGFNPLPPILELVGRSEFDPDGEAWVDFRSGWVTLASRLNAIPEVGSLLDGRVDTYIFEWDSSRGFLPAFGSLLLAKVADAAATNALNQGDPLRAISFRVRANQFEASARNYATRSALLAESVAVQITRDVKALLPASGPTPLIHLIGHSRGAAVNARVSEMLWNAGYFVDEYTALDGFSIDWPDGAGDIGDIDIVSSASAGWKVNYRVQQDIANYVVDLFEDHIPDNVFVTLLFEIIEFWRPGTFREIPAFGLEQGTRDLLRQLDLRAPERSPGFLNYDLVAPIDEDAPFSNHVNVTEIYTTSGDKNGEGEFIRPEFQRYILDNYVGRHRDDPVIEGENRMRPPLDALPPQMSFAAKRASSNGLALPAASIRKSGYFVDGSFESLAGFLAELRETDSVETGNDVIDAWFEVISDPAVALSSYWDSSGDVELVEEAENALLELRQTADTWVGQPLIVGEDAGSVAFDLTVVAAGPNDQLEVRFGDQSLGTFALAEVPASGRYAVPFSDFASQTAELTFRITGPQDVPAVIQLDNLAVESNLLPVAVNDNEIFTASEQPVPIHVLQNDSDPDGSLDPSTVVIVVPPGNGGVSVDPATGVVTYTPDPGFVDVDTFQYTVDDNDGATSNPATVTVTVVAENTLLGDLNGDGSLNNLDIDPFMLALRYPGIFRLDYPHVNPVIVGDINGDGAFNDGDIQPFALLLMSLSARSF